MADIRSYRKEKEKREQNRIDYKSKIMRYKLKNVYRVLLVAVAFLAIIALVMIQYKRHVYTGYDIVSTIALESSSGAENRRLQSSILTYSKDGAHCTNSKGEVTWNQTYEIQNVKLALCRNVVAIANYNGREIYVQDTDKQLGTITTNLPIHDITVSATGNVTAVLSDANATKIYTYDVTGKELFRGEASMKEMGYPVSVSLSPNGILLGVSYIYLDAGTLTTNLCFYNLDSVGDNKKDQIVGIYFYPDVLIPEIHFMDDKTAFAVGDDRLVIFKGGQTPVNTGTYMLDSEVRSVYYNEKYIGLVFSADDAEHNYMMDVYNADGRKVDTYYFDLDYQDIFFEEEGFVVYNDSECLIMTYGGVEKFNGYFSKVVDLLFPTNGAYKYVMVTENSMDTIQLK